MADRLVRVPLYAAQAITNAGTLTTGAIDLTRATFESLVLQVTSVAGAASVKAEYAISSDGTTFGSFDDEADLIAATGAQTNPEGLHTIPGVTVAAPYMQIKLTDLASTGDSLVTAVVWLREAS